MHTATRSTARNSARMFNRIKPFIGHRILELGAGKFREHLGDGERSVAHAHLRDLQRAEHGSVTGPCFDTVICSNGLGNVQDDHAALSSMFSVLAPGGRLVLAVPAFNPQRTYTKKTLIPKMRQADFRIESVFYMDAIGMAGIGLLDGFVAGLADRVERAISLPFGMHLVAIGRKPRYTLNFKARA
jgi:SAM-dependent methyltransferase